MPGLDAVLAQRQPAQPLGPRRERPIYSAIFVADRLAGQELPRGGDIGWSHHALWRRRWRPDMAPGPAVSIFADPGLGLIKEFCPIILDTCVSRIAVTNDLINGLSRDRDRSRPVCRLQDGDAARRRHGQRDLDLRRRKADGDYRHRGLGRVDRSAEPVVCVNQAAAVHSSGSRMSSTSKSTSSTAIRRRGGDGSSPTASSGAALHFERGWDYDCVTPPRLRNAQASITLPPDRPSPLRYPLDLHRPSRGGRGRDEVDPLIYLDGRFGGAGGERNRK